MGDLNMGFSRGGLSLAAAYNRMKTVSVDACGARGDCPLTGSTAGATNDLAAFAKALADCPDGGWIKLTPGKCYMLAPSNRTDIAEAAGGYGFQNGGLAAADILGKQINVDATGATVRVGNDSVWSLFRIGGVDEDNMLEDVTILGGTWCGNQQNQRYFPSAYAVPDTVADTGKADAYTEVGTEADAIVRANTGGIVGYTKAGGLEVSPDAGDLFYPNSPLNGGDWHWGWYTGAANPQNINLRANGNEGLVKVQYVKRVNFVGVRVVNTVMNGMVALSAETVRFSGCSAAGGLPTNLNEIWKLYTDNASPEPAYFKVQSFNLNSQALPSRFAQHVVFDGVVTEGGSLPIFVRTNNPKSVSSGVNVRHVDCSYWGFSRDIWHEECEDLAMTNCQMIGDMHPDSTFRKACGLFIANQTKHWHLDGCYIEGHVDTRAGQGLVLGTVSNSHIITPSTIASPESDSSGSDFGVVCDSIVNSLIESEGRAARCTHAVNSTFLGESRCLSLRGSAVNCTAGRERYDGATFGPHQFTGDATSVDVGDTDLGDVTQIFRAFHWRDDFQGGRRFLIDRQDIASVTAGVVTFVGGDKNGDKFVAGDWIEIEYWTPTAETFTATAGQTEFTTTTPGGHRRKDITVSVAGTPTENYAWDINADGTITLTLDTGAALNDAVIITTNPPLAPYGDVVIEGNRESGDFARWDGRIENITTVLMEGDLHISGIMLDMADHAAITVQYAAAGDDPEEIHRLKITELTAKRLANTLVHPPTPATTADKMKSLEIVGLYVEDWNRFKARSEFTNPASFYLVSGASNGLGGASTGMWVTDTVYIDRVVANATETEANTGGRVFRIGGATASHVTKPLLLGATSDTVDVFSTTLREAAFVDDITYTSAYDGTNPLALGSWQIWVSAAGDLKMNDGTPGADSAGEVIGEQPIV